MAYAYAQEFHPRADTVGHFDWLAIADDRRDAAQKLAFVDRRIFVLQRITASGNQMLKPKNSKYRRRRR